MRKLLLLASLCMIAALVLPGTAFAQSRGPSGADGTFNCSDFDDQGQAQEFSLGDPDDENGLDEDGDGIVCESLPTVTEDGVVPGAGEDQYGASGAQYGQYGSETGAPRGGGAGTRRSSPAGLTVHERKKAPPLRHEAAGPESP